MSTQKPLPLFRSSPNNPQTSFDDCSPHDYIAGNLGDWPKVSVETIIHHIQKAAADHRRLTLEISFILPYTMQQVDDACALVQQAMRDAGGDLKLAFFAMGTEMDSYLHYEFVVYLYNLTLEGIVDETPETAMKEGWARAHVPELFNDTSQTRH